jgi:histidine triad (HIT) family protein
MLVSCCVHHNTLRQSAYPLSLRSDHTLRMRIGHLIRTAFLSSTATPFSLLPLSPIFSSTAQLVHKQHHYSTTAIKPMSASTPKNDEVSKAATAASSPLPEETIFSKIVAGQIPCSIVYEDDSCLAFHDVSPQAPIHIVLIPKNVSGLSRLSTCPPDSPDHIALLGKLMYHAGRIGREHCPEGFRVVVNDGKEGCQSVYHLHLHVLGGKQLGWPPG